MYTHALSAVVFSSGVIVTMDSREEEPSSHRFHRAISEVKKWAGLRTSFSSLVACVHPRMLPGIFTRDFEKWKYDFYVLAIGQVIRR